MALALAGSACSANSSVPSEPSPSGTAESAGGVAGAAGSSSGGASARPGSGTDGAGTTGGTSGTGNGTAGNGSGGVSGGYAVPNCGLDPADADASSKARNLLCYLKTHTNISGQTDMADGDYVEEMTGRYPAIIAFDFYRYTDGDTSETQKAIDFSKDKKGIVAFQWHWKAPPGGEFYTDWDFPSALDDPNNKLHQDIELVVSELKKMGDAGVPVLFRPLHECNNNYMWWAKHGPENYKKLWNLIFEEAQKVGAHNIVWVFNGMASGQSTPMSDWYPGDDKADVVGSDYYQDQNDYETLSSIGTNKVVSIPETFNALLPDQDPPFSYFVVWASRDWGGKGAEDSWKKSMASSNTISLSELPDMSAW